MITVDDILREKRHSRIITVRMNETVATAALIMKRENISSVVVKDVCRTEGNTVVGVFSERDVTRALVDFGANAVNMPVASFIKRALTSCALSDTIATVLRLMNEHEVRHLPVLAEHGLVGVISATDLIRHYLHEEESDAQPSASAVTVGAVLSALR